MGYDLWSDAVENSRDFRHVKNALSLVLSSGALVVPVDFIAMALTALPDEQARATQAVL